MVPYYHDSACIARYFINLAVMVFLLFALIVSAAQKDMPPLNGLTHYGYTVTQARDGFRGTVFAKYASGPDWQMLYSMRRKRSQAVKDCEGWMDRVDAAIRKARHGVEHKAKKSS